MFYASQKKCVKLKPLKYCHDAENSRLQRLDSSKNSKQNLSADEEISKNGDKSTAKEWWWVDQT